MKRNIIILSALALLVACQPKDVEPEQMFKTEDEITQMLQAEPDGYVLYDEAKGGLHAFLNDFMTEDGDFYPYRSRSVSVSDSSLFLFSIDTIPTQGQGIYIRGRITTDDAGGNFYKAMVIQQMVGGKQQALRLSVDLGNASGMYSIGQEILIRVNGLAIGRYANQPQLCVPSFNNNLNASHYNEKVGWAPGRIPAAKARAAITRIGTPDISKLHYDVIKLSDLVTSSTDSKESYGKSLYTPKEARMLDARLVRIENVHFTGEYATTAGKREKCSTGNPETDGNANVFGPTTGNVGYPQSRVITDGSVYMMVATSEYANYSHMYLPSEDFAGTVQGILGFYMDNIRYSASWSSWSISLRDLTDLDLSDGAQMWVPEEWQSPAK